MSAEIITYWNGEELSYVLNAISALINSTDFNSLLKIVSYLGVMIVFMMGVLGQMKQEDWPKYVAALAVFVFVMTGPKETVTITDKSITMPSTVVGNVPMPLAWIGSTTSGIGSWLTDSVETVFQVLPPLFSGHTPYPPELSFTGGGGPLFGHRIIQESGMMSINTPILSQDMMEFYRECVIPDINTGYLDVNQLNKSANIWAMLDNTNPARYVTIHNYNAGTGKWAWDTSAINCQQAYAHLTGYLNSEAAANLKQLGRRMNYKSTQAAAEALIVGQLQNGYGAMLGISANAVDIVQQKMMTNFIREASYKIPAMSGDPSSTQIGLAQAQAEAQYASSSLTMRKVAEGLLPKVRNVIEALIYALFPILIIYVIMAGHNALKPFAMYLKLAIWIQLWPMLYAILNFFITFGAAKQWQAQTLGDGLAMQYSALINAGAASDMAVAGMMVSSIPAIAWMLASGSVYAATQVANGMMAPANSAASSAGSQAALGNISMGNTNLRTANADKYDMTPSINTGTMSMRGGDGMQHNIMTGGRTSMNAGLQMDNLPVNASSNFEKAASLNQSASVAKQSAMTHQSSYETSIGSAMSKVAGKVMQGGYDTSFSNTQDQGLRTTLSEGASSVRSLADSLSRGTGIKSDQMAKLMLDASGKGLSIPGLGAQIKKEYGSSASAQFDQNLKSANQSDIKKVADFTTAISDNQQAMQGFNFSQSERTGIESNLQQARTSKQAMSASLQESKNYQEQAQEAIKTALMAGYDLGKTGAGRMAFLAAEKVRREGGGFNEQASAALKAFMDDNALKHAPVNLPSNAASPVLTGGNNAITRDYTGNQASVNVNNATGLAGAAGANPNQFKQFVDGKTTDLAFKQEATTVAAREFDAQQQGKDATTTQKLDADPNNPNNKGVSVGGRGQVQVNSSQVGDVTYGAAQDAAVTVNNVVSGPIGNAATSMVNAIGLGGVRDGLIKAFSSDEAKPSTGAPQTASSATKSTKEPVTQGTEAKTTSTTPATDRVQPSTGMANASPDQSSQVMMSASDNTNRPDVSHNQSANDRGAQAEVRTVETQTQTNTVETQHHTRTVTQQAGESSRPKSAPKVGNDQPKDAKPSDRGEKPDVS